MHRKPLHIFIIFSFLLVGLAPSKTIASEVLNLPKPGAMVHLSPAFEPVLLKGIKLHPENPLQFDFLVDPGQSNLTGDPLKEDSTRLIKYFLASLTVPDQDLWVNLSPYEKDRIVPESLGITEMGRDLLAQDYILKQLTSSLVYPDEKTGKEFWARIYSKAREKFGSTAVKTYNKVWILPDRATVYEHNGAAYVLDSHLKVMLDEDYLASQKNTKVARSPKGSTTYFGAASQIVREVLLPEIEREVNEGKNFQTLRQINNALILAVWYKQNLKETLLGQVYVNQNKVKGIDLQDRSLKEKIYNRYLEAFKKGVYDFIKEDYDPQTNQTVARKYFSGGYNAVRVRTAVRTIRGDPSQLPRELRNSVANSKDIYLVRAGLSDAAELSRQDRVQEIKESKYQGFPVIEEKALPDWMLNVLSFYNSLGPNKSNVAKDMVQSKRSRAGYDFKEILRIEKDGDHFLIATNDVLQDPDEIFMERFQPKYLSNYLRWKAGTRSKAIAGLGLYLNGINVPKLAYLREQGIFDLFKNGDDFRTVSMADIVAYVRTFEPPFNTPNDQHLHAAMRILESFGWLIRSTEKETASPSDLMEFILTDKGKEAIRAISPLFSDVRDFMPESIRFGDYLMGRPNAPEIKRGLTLKGLVQDSLQGWGIKVQNKELFKQLNGFLDGYLIGHLVIALSEEGIFEKFDSELTIDINDLLGNPQELEAAFDLFQKAGFVEKVADRKYKMTEEGLAPFTYSLNYGTSISYDPLQKLEKVAMFGDIANVPRTRPDGSESLVDRKRNIEASRKNHIPYFRHIIRTKLIEKIVEPIFPGGEIPVGLKRQIDQGKKLVLVWADTGSGEGEFLKFIYKRVMLILGHLVRNKEMYLEMVGIDKYAISRDSTEARLNAFGIPNTVLEGDITTPEENIRLVEEKMKAKYGQDAIIMIKDVTSFLPHNRDFEGVQDVAAAQQIKSKSTTVVGWMGQVIPNNYFEQNLREYFGKWVKALKKSEQDGLLMVELGTIDPKIAAQVQASLDGGYYPPHVASDQLLVELLVQVAAMEKAGLHPEYLTPFPSLPERATVFIGYLTLLQSYTSALTRYGILANSRETSTFAPVSRIKEMSQNVLTEPAVATAVTTSLGQAFGRYADAKKDALANLKHQTLRETVEEHPNLTILATEHQRIYNRKSDPRRRDPLSLTMETNRLSLDNSGEVWYFFDVETRDDNQLWEGSVLVKKRGVWDKPGRINLEGIFANQELLKTMMKDPKVGLSNVQAIKALQGEDYTIALSSVREASMEDNKFKARTLVFTNKGTLSMETDFHADNPSAAMQRIVSSTPVARAFETQETDGDTDEAMEAKAVDGGIALDPAMLNLQVKRDAKSGLQAPAFQRLVDNALNAEGYFPIIIGIRRTNLPELMGFSVKK